MRWFPFLIAFVFLFSGCIAANPEDRSYDDEVLDEQPADHNEDGIDDSGDDGGDNGGHDPGAGNGTSWSYSQGGSISSGETASISAPGGSATVSVNAGGSGSARLVVKDADGQVVLDRDLSTEGGTQFNQSVTGTAGIWVIELDVDAWYGGLQIHVQGS
jgi:hypothetical protein